MSKREKAAARIGSGVVEIKSKFDAEFRRFSVNTDAKSFIDFEDLVKKIHNMNHIQFAVCYTDPDGDLLPINNDDNFQKALTTAKPLLRLIVQRKGTGFDLNGYGTYLRKKGPLSKIMGGPVESRPRSHIPISLPEDFRRVSAIIDVDVVPETHRRVKLMKNGTDKPLGFYIRDGTSVCVMPHGLEKVPGIFISRLVPGGLAESTGLLAVNDEVLEVNGIEVTGKTLDQVTDMMVANSSNLIITVKPVNQRNNVSPSRGGSGRQSQKSYDSHRSGLSAHSMDSDEVREIITPEEEDEDDIHDHLSPVETAAPVSLADEESESSPATESNKSENKEETPKDPGLVTL